MDNLQTMKNIYYKFFTRTYEDTCYVFLCGGVDKTCIRNKVREHLESVGIQVLYPEDLFIEMFNKNKDSNLMDYENLLAKSSDSIFIICESFGSAAELGAFAQSKYTRPKLLVGINKKYSRNNSFIMDGPIKSLKREDSKRILLYDTKKLSSFYSELDRYYRKLRFSKHLSSILKNDPDFDLLPSYISFVPMVIYFYQEISRKVLFTTLRNFLESEQRCPKDYNELFNASLRYLHKLGIILTEGNVNISKNVNKQIIRLSDKGLDKVLNLLKNSYVANKTMLHDKIRCDILKEQLNK